MKVQNTCPVPFKSVSDTHQKKNKETVKIIKGEGGGGGKREEGEEEKNWKKGRRKDQEHVTDLWILDRHDS